MAPSKNADKSPGLNAFETRVAASHAYLLSTLTAHTLKDLEKSLPATVQGVSSMNVKDHVQALVDEGLLRVEKIGTGNWYWCFGSENLFQRNKVKEKLLAEKTGLKSHVEALQIELADEKSARGDELNEEYLMAREQLLNENEATKACIKHLADELSKFEDGDPTVLQERREQTKKMKDATEIWTENCWTLEGWMRDSLGLGREDSVAVLRQCYGQEFVEEDGGLNDVAT